jgi:phospholipid-binding lipoprotein MlaA
VFDKALVAPAAKVYKEVVPSPLRKGLHNFLSNLGEPVIAMNFLLQLHPGRALKTIGRFGLNTTIGIGGVLDVAKTRTFKLPFHPNGFADTLGYYGVKPGPYFYLPFLGATTLRDVVGYTIDGFGLPTLIGKPFNKLYYTIPANTIRSLDYRVRYDNQLREIRETKNPYVTARITYLQQRRDEIEALHSHPARQRDTVPQPSSAPTTSAPVAPVIPAPSATTPPPAGDTPPATPPKE